MGSCQHPDHHHPEHGHRPVRYVEGVVRGKIALVRSLGMRRTRLLESVLRELAGRDRPVTIGQIEESIGSVCDTATLYRMIERLVEAGVLRRIGFHERARYYELVIPGRHHDYLICTACGAIGDIELACPVDTLERELAERTGYTGLQHDLLFFGRCPECQREA